MSDWDYWNSWNFWDRKKYRSGYMDMGPQQIPVLPHKIVLTDTVTGLMWQLTYNTSTLALTKTTPNLKGEGAFVYDNLSGPRFPENTDYMLQLINGTYKATLSLFSPHVSDENTAPIYARNDPKYRQVLLSEFL